MQNIKSYISNSLRKRQAQSYYNLLCNQARETTHVCTYFRYNYAKPGDNWFLKETCFFDSSKLPKRRSAIIFGSGPSSLTIGKDRLLKLKENYLIVGFNFASLLDIPFDLYFFEAFGLGQLHTKELEAAYLLANEGTSVVFKCVWMHRYPSLQDLADLSRHQNISILRSYKLPSLQHEWIPQHKASHIYLKSLFCPQDLDGGYYKEAFSTMLTILPILRDAGIEDIHLIGCDMVHDYFFRSEVYLPPKNKIAFIPSEQELPRTYNTMHITGSQTVENVIKMIPLVNTLGLANVTIDYAVQGPLSKSLPRKEIA